MYRSAWLPHNQAVIDRLRRLPHIAVYQPTHRIHVLDLLPEGEVMPHIDHVKYAGPVVIGLSLLSPAIMQLTDENSKFEMNVLDLSRTHGI